MSDLAAVTGKADVENESRKAENIDSVNEDNEKSTRGLATVENGAIDVSTDLTPEEQRAVVRKVDMRLVPLLAFLYLVSFIDRSNIGNAKVAGLTKDLHMGNGPKYNTAVTLFFVPYTLLEVPSNIVLKLMRPSWWIAILLFFWGTTMTLMGVVSSYSGLLAARWFLGVTESGFFPGATYLLTLWYLRYEVQRRLAVFYAAASLSGAFSGLLAYAIQKMDGVRGLGGWQWIFIIEGLVPVALSLVVWKVLPDSPATAHFLTKPEREYLVNRLALETGSGHGKVTNEDKISKKFIIAGFKEWKIWAGVVVYWGNAVGVYGFTATVPSVIKGLGYSAANAQLLTIPVYVFACAIVLIFAWMSDYYKQRTPFILAGFCIAVVGFTAQLAIPHPKYPGLTYGFLFPVAAGIYSPFICLVALIGNNLAPSSKRAVGMAVLICFGNMGGILGSNIYIGKQAPKYQAGFGTSLALCCMAIVACIALRWGFNRENRRRERLLLEKGEDAIRAQYTEQELLDLGDKSPFFRYTL